MTTFLQKMGLSKTHKYESPLQFKNFSVEQILNIDPNDVGFNIREKEGVELEHGEKSKALAFLLLIKENEKKHIWNKEDRETHIKKYLATEKEINNTRENNVNNLVENTKKKVDTEQKPIRDDQARLNELDPRYTNLKQRVESLKATPTTNVEEDFEEFLLLQEAEAKNKENAESEELQDYFEENGGRRKSKKRKQRHSKSKKKKTQHIKHFKSKKNKSIKKLQKRKTRVMRNK